MSAEAVRAFIAQRWLSHASPPRRVGAFTLRPSQHDAVRAVERAFHEFGGALVANPPGTGKTVIALAVSQRAERVLVVAPATLREQWRAAAARAERELAFASFESLSRGLRPTPATLVIVDEAHHARTPTTRRYRALAALCVGAEVLLLSATPVVNRRDDLRALLALFLGARAESLDADALARVVIRRVADDAGRPRVRASPPLTGLAPPSGLAEAIGALPPPLPAADGTVALALIKISLAMAWGSSLAALDAALRRRMQRADALADSLALGRWPDHHTLAQWIIGDDATQLAMPLLFGESSRVPPADALTALQTHVTAVRSLRALVRPLVERDAVARADALRMLMESHPDTRVVVFARHAETIAALWRAMRGVPGVIAITGARVRAAQGRWSRDEVLRALGPRAKPLRHDDPRAIRLLLTTDLLAEGVELQGVGIIVHGDGAWNPARFKQRTGRVARLGGIGEVLETRFEMPAEAEELLRLNQRLQRKSRARDRALREADARERLEARVATWAGTATPVRVAAAQSILNGFLALVGDGDALTLIGARRLRGRWRVCTSPERLRHIVACAEGPSRPIREFNVIAARKVLARWCASRAAREVIGHAATASVVTRAARGRVDRIVFESALAKRPALAAATDALNRLTQSGGVGAGRALHSLLRARANVSVGGAARHHVHPQAPDATYLADLEALAASVERTSVSTHTHTHRRPRLIALLLLEPDEPFATATRTRVHI